MSYLTKPTQFTEAVDKLGKKRIISKALKSEQWYDVPVALRERAFFSAMVENAKFLQTAKNIIGDFLTEARQTIPKEDGSTVTALKAGSRGDFVTQMKELFGGGSDQAGGKITDPLSTTRLKLIFSTQTRQAWGFGKFKQGQDPEILDQWPAQRFVRGGYVQEPRPLHEEHENEVHLKSDLAFWLAMNSSEIGGFEVPWPPFGFNSQMDVEDVSRDEAEELGLIQPGQKITVPEMDFNAGLSASVQGLDPEILSALQGALGDTVVIQDGKIWWKGDSGAPKVKSPTKPKELAAEVKPEEEKPKPAYERPAPEDHLPAVVEKWYAQQVEFRKEKDNLRDRIDAIKTGIKTLDGGSGQFGALIQEKEKLKSRLFYLVELTYRRAEKINALILRRLAKKDPGTFSVDYSKYAINEFSKKSLQRQVDFINKVTGKDAELPKRVKLTIDVNSTERSFFFLNKIELKGGVMDFAHECGHALEYNHPKLLERSLKFLRDRIANGHAAEMNAAAKKYNGSIPEEVKVDIDRRYTKRKMSEITGVSRYKNNEMATQDKFKEAYTGKDYGSGATEVLSMGLEQLFRNPVEFANSDPDFFKFVIRTLSGKEHEVKL